MTGTSNVSAIHDEAVLRQRFGSAWQELTELGVIKEGHFRRHDYRHTKWYYDTVPLFLTGRIWTIMQDLAAVINPEVVEQIEFIAGPGYRGNILAFGLANVLSARSPASRPIQSVPIERQFQIVGPDLGKSEHWVRKRYLELLAGRGVLLADDVLATGKTRTGCFHLLTQAGAKVLGSVSIIDASQMDSSCRKLTGYHAALKVIPAKDVYEATQCPMCRSSDEKIRAITEF